MTKKHFLFASALVACIGGNLAASAKAQAIPDPVSQGPAAPVAAPVDAKLLGREVVAQAAHQQKFTFVLFWKQNDAPTQAMAKELTAQLSPVMARAMHAVVLVSDPAEAEVVKQFGVSRAPMPLLVAVAPNGAVTGFFQGHLPAGGVSKAIVTPTMQTAMKSMQAGKIVLVNVQTQPSATLPAGVSEFINQPEFSQRTVAVSMVVSDPNEARFVQEMKIPQDGKPYIAMLAPPGVLVGLFYSHATKADLASKLHAAGKCCDDENCKHNHK